MKRKIKERLKRELVKLLAATMVVGCLDGISFSGGVLPGSRVEAGEGVTTGNQITNQLPADYAIAYKVNETPSAVNVPIGDSVIFIPNGYSAGDTTKIYGEVPKGSAVLRRVSHEAVYSPIYTYSEADFTVWVDRSAEGFDLCSAGDLRGTNLSSYYCNGGAVKDLKGRSYVMDKVPYYQKVTVKLDKNDSP